MHQGWLRVQERLVPSLATTWPCPWYSLLLFCCWSPVILGPGFYRFIFYFARQVFTMKIFINSYLLHHKYRARKSVTSKFSNHWKYTIRINGITMSISERKRRMFKCFMISYLRPTLRGSKRDFHFQAGTFRLP